jgi:MFS transporter, MHS family, proline/betaine transporter
MFFGSWAPLIAVRLLANAGDLLPYLLGLNLIIGSIIIIIGTRINPETRDVELS